MFLPKNLRVEKERQYESLEQSVQEVMGGLLPDSLFFEFLIIIKKKITSAKIF